MFPNIGFDQIMGALVSSNNSVPESVTILLSLPPLKEAVMAVDCRTSMESFSIVMMMSSKLMSVRQS